MKLHAVLKKRSNFQKNLKFGFKFFIFFRRRNLLLKKPSLTFGESRPTNTPHIKKEPPGQLLGRQESKKVK